MAMKPPFGNGFPLVNVYITMAMENHHFSWETHYKWPCSIAMLNYRRIINPSMAGDLGMACCWVETSLPHSEETEMGSHFQRLVKQLQKVNMELGPEFQKTLTINHNSQYIHFLYMCMNTIFVCIYIYAYTV